MKKNTLKTLLLLTLGITLFACKPEDPKDEQKNLHPDVWILNEGTWHSNNAGITAYDSKEKAIIADYFARQNQRKLGDVANDILIYGNKAYVAVNLSSTIEIIRTDNGQSIRQIFLSEQQTPSQVRCICAGEGKIYVSCYDGNIHRIDTSSLTIEASGKAGSNPDGICFSNGKLYVCNSGGLNYPNYDTTVSVMDPVSMKVEKTIPVRCNPGRALSDGFGHVWILSAGDYQAIGGCLQCIDSRTDSLLSVFEEQAVDLSVCGQNVYLLETDWNSGTALCKVIDAASLQPAGTLIEQNGLTAPYGINVRPSDGSIWITDALDYTSDGDIYLFDNKGIMKQKFEVGVCPKRMAFLK